jgi:hypothetical protein
VVRACALERRPPRRLPGAQHTTPEVGKETETLSRRLRRPQAPISTRKQKARAYWSLKYAAAPLELVPFFVETETLTMAGA